LAALGPTEAKTRFFIQRVAEGDQNGKVAEGGLGYFETTAANKIIEAFPCAEVNSTTVVAALLGLERMKQLLGTGDENALQNIAGAMGCEYLVALKINVTGQNALVSAFCMDSKKAKTLARRSENGPLNTALEMIDKVVKNMVDDLKEYEICPYYGPVTIEVKSELDDSKTDYVPAPCGSGDMVTINTTQKSNSTLKWELNKYTVRAADGTANYDLNEKMTIESNYSCYKCKNGDQGAAKITETTESEAKTQGLSDESVSEGKQVKDARIKLTFLDDGTYTVLVEATSKQGNMKVTTGKKVEGICESESEPEDTKNKKIDVPIKAVFGPYKGSLKDKTLHQNETKDLSNGKEKTTLKLDFTLTQKK
jgi:hypothetical protein